MDIAVIAALLGVLAACSWGIADYMVGRSAKALGPLAAALLVNVLGAVVYAGAYALFLHTGVTFTASGMAYTVAAGVCFGVAQVAFFRAMHLGPIGLVSAVSSVYPLCTLLVSVLFFAARISAVQALGILLVVGGVVAASGISVRGRLGKGPLVALLPVLAWGTGWGLAAQAVTKMSWQAVSLIDLFVTVGVLLLLVPFVKGSERIRFAGLRAGLSMSVVWCAAVVQMLGMLWLYLGVNAVPHKAAIVVAISSCYPVLTIFLALRNLNEKLPLVPLLGGIVGILGIVILSLG